MPSWLTLLILRENSNVAEHAVVNASPLIFLSRAGLIDLLQLVSSEVIVPEAVASEIDIRGKGDPRLQHVTSKSFEDANKIVFEVKRVFDRPVVVQPLSDVYAFRHCG